MPGPARVLARAFRHKEALADWRQNAVKSNARLILQPRPGAPTPENGPFSVSSGRLTFYNTQQLNSATHR